MKKLLLSILFLITVANAVFAQKLYVWEPKPQSVSQRPFYTESDTIDVVMYDGRIFSKKSKIECTSEELIESIYDVLKQAYGKATICLMNSSEYNKKPLPGHVTIKIGIAAYGAGFGTDVSVGIGSVGGSFSYGVFPKGKWNAVTSFLVRVYDKRNGQVRSSEKSISHTDSKSNMLGYSSAKKALNNTYMSSISELLLAIDNGLMEE